MARDGRLFLIRHAATAWNEEGRFNSVTDTPLSSEGAAQAERLGRQLAGVLPAAVFCSPMTRTLETARRAMSQLEPGVAAIQEDRRLVEMDFGKLEGRLAAEVEMPDVGLPDQWSLSAAEAAERARQVFEEFRWLRGDVLVFSHGYFIRLFVAHAMLGLRVEAIRKFSIGNCCVVTLEPHNGQVRLTGYNC